MSTTYVTSAGNVRYRANWRDASGRQRCQSFLTEAEATAHEDAVRAEMIGTNVRVCKLERCENVVEQIQGRGRREFCCQAHKQEYNNDPQRRGPRSRPAAVLRPPVVCKLEECESLVPQNPRGRPGEFCCIEHGRTFHNRQIAQAKGPDARHYITNADEAMNRGTCSVCGPGVAIWSFIDTYEDGSPRKRFRCQAKGAAARIDSHRRYDRSRKGWLAKIRVRYGLSPERYDAIVLAHEGRCGCCGGELLNGGHIDHDHQTKQVRGLLCIGCNSEIGKCGDTTWHVERILDYLRRTRHASNISTANQPG